VKSPSFFWLDPARASVHFLGVFFLLSSFVVFPSFQTGGRKTIDDERQGRDEKNETTQDARLPDEQAASE